jgi:hypothetical protein
VTASEDDSLLFAWLSPIAGEVTGGLSVPRSLIAEIAADPEPWEGIRTDLTGGPFVDMQKMFVGEGAAAG